MTGIVAAVAGSSKRINTADGWYNQGTGSVDLSPIQTSLVAGFGGISGTYTWIGYLQVATSGSYTTSIQTTFISNGTFGSSSVGNFWIGDNAIAPAGGANITTSNSTGSFVISLTQGVFYPCRFQWDFNLAYNFGTGFGAQGTAIFRLNGSTNVSGLIFYNASTNGF